MKKYSEIISYRIIGAFRNIHKIIRTTYVEAAINSRGESKKRQSRFLSEMKYRKMIFGLGRIGEYLNNRIFLKIAKVQSERSLFTVPLTSDKR